MWDCIVDKKVLWNLSGSWKLSWFYFPAVASVFNGTFMYIVSINSNTTLQHNTATVFCITLLCIMFHLFLYCLEPSRKTKDPSFVLTAIVAVMDSGVIEGGLNVTLTIRLLMHGKVRSPISCLCRHSKSKQHFIYGNEVIHEEQGFNEKSKSICQIIESWF